jgi:hypothetical protein
LGPSSTCIAIFVLPQSTLNNLALDPLNRKTIGESGGIETIVLALRMFGHHDARLSEACCGALQNLACEGACMAVVGGGVGMCIARSLSVRGLVH